MNYNKIGPTSTDKVRGKLVKYRKGDCFSLDCSNGMFLAAFISEKFNKYYDFTLIEYYKERKPSTSDFLNGHFFGSYIGTRDGYQIGLAKLMMECLKVDVDPCFEKVAQIPLKEKLERGSYQYNNDVSELLDHYKTELPIILQKTINKERMPQLDQLGSRLISMKEILQ